MVECVFMRRHTAVTAAISTQVHLACLSHSGFWHSGTDSTSLKEMASLFVFIPWIFLECQTTFLFYFELASCYVPINYYFQLNGLENSRYLFFWNQLLWGLISSKNNYCWHKRVFEFVVVFIPFGSSTSTTISTI